MAGPRPPSGPPPAEPPAADPVTQRALETLRAEAPESVLGAHLTGPHPWIRIAPQGLRAAARVLRDHPALRYDCCHLVSGVDWPAGLPDAGGDPLLAAPCLEVVYHLVSYVVRPDPDYARRAEKNDPFLALKVFVPREAPEVPTVMDLWVGADWHERETWDLVGVRFTGRAELPRILLPEDWPGHPLRKDWEYPASYHGVPIVPPEGL